MSDRTHARIPSIGRDTFKVAVDLRATQPDRNGFQSYRFGSYSSAHQWPDQTYDPNPKKLDNTKSRLHLWARDGYLKWPSISERRSPTKTASNHIDLDRTGMPTNGMTEPELQPKSVSNKWLHRLACIKC